MDADLYGRVAMSEGVTIVDYGMGNIWSVRNALRYVGCESTLTSNADEIRRAHTLVLPGVGSFRLAMVTLMKAGIDQGLPHCDGAQARGS